MDIINHLERTVTPAILGDNRNPQNESLLKQFYALFSAKMADKATYARFAGRDIASDDGEFYDCVWADEGDKNSISRELAASNNVNESEVKGLVATAAPLVYRELNSLAGTTPVPQFLRDNLATYRDHIPSWATTIIPAGLLTAAPAGERISDTVSTAPLHREEKPEGNFLKALLPIIGLIILGALAWMALRGCEDKPEPVAAPVAVVEKPAENAPVAALEPAVLALSTGEGTQLYSCRINVGNDALGTSVRDALSTVFNTEAEKCRTDVYSNFATDMPAAKYLSAILPILQKSPNASAIIKGNQITVNSPDAATLQQLVADMQAAAPEMQVIAERPLDLQGAIDASITGANTAFDNLGDNPDPHDVARALSLQIINFEFNKAVIPDVNKPVLDRAVDIMKKIPNMELLIVGHTDAIGSNAYNIPLSQKRAQAVKDYLVSKGADPAKLKIKGMGESEPTASNETDQGRFRNRRIEYVVYDASMGEADANGIVVAPASQLRETEVKNKGTSAKTASATATPPATTDAVTVAPAPTTGEVEVDTSVATTTDADATAPTAADSQAAAQ